MTERKGENEISNHKVLVTAILLASLGPALFASLRVVRFVHHAAVVHGGLAVGACAQLARLEELLSHLLHVIFGVLSEFHRDSLKDHIVLSQSSSLVG